MNIDSSAIAEQYEQEAFDNSRRKRTEYNPANYLGTRLGKDETSKTLTIRLLPFEPTGGSPFKKVFVHTVKVSKEFNPSGWKTFICPVENHKGDKCPFCEIAERAKEQRQASTSEAEKKKYGELEYSNRARPAWIVRAIERGKEDEGVKFWLFNDSRKGDGVYNKMMNVYFERKKSAERKGKTCNIFDLNDGKDLIVSISKDANGKTVYNIVDDDERSPLATTTELGMSWINDTKLWTDVYTVKPYEYMAIVAVGGVPVFDKEKNKFVDKNDADSNTPEVEVAQHPVDYSTADPVAAETPESFSVNAEVNIEEPPVSSDAEEPDDLPF